MDDWRSREHILNAVRAARSVPKHHEGDEDADVECRFGERWIGKHGPQPETADGKSNGDQYDKARKRYRTKGSIRTPPRSISVCGLIGAPSDA